MLGWRIALLLAAAAGCGGAVTVRGEVVQPARVPVRSFPRIVVTAPEDAESQQLARTVARHLALGRSEVERAARPRVRAMRESGRLGRATVVLDVRTTLSERDRPQWRRSGEVECGPLGCFESRRSVVRDVPIVSGHLRVTVTDGPSGRTLQRVELAEEETGPDVLGMRLRVLERLADRTLAMLDQRIEHVAVQLLPIDRPDVLRALEDAQHGRWAEGRVRLETFVASEVFASLTREQRAVVLYDLGQMLRFDTTMPAERRFERAATAFRAAVRLVPQPLFARAIADLDGHRRSRRMVREQQEAMAHNFALATGDYPD